MLQHKTPDNVAAASKATLERDRRTSALPRNPDITDFISITHSHRYSPGTSGLELPGRYHPRAGGGAANYDSIADQ